MAPSTDQGIIYPANTNLRQIARDFKRMADSINVPLSILMDSVLGEGVVDATDPVVASLITDDGSAVSAALSARYLPASVALDQHKRAYQKRIKLALPFRSPDYSAMQATWGDHYPQSFAVDAEQREMFICSRSRTPGGVTTGIVVAVYDWDTGAYKSSFGVTTTEVSGGAAVRWEGTSRFLYLRTGNTSLGKFAITTLPTNLATVTPVDTLDVQLGLAEFTYHNDTFTVADNTAPYGGAGARSRGQFKRVDADTLATTGYFLVDETLVGGNAYAYASSVFPKSQGLADGGGYYAFSIGGFWDASTAVDHYSYQGIRLISPGGDVLVDALMDPSKMVPILNGAGLNPTRIENEGVQIVDGGVYTLTCTRTFSGSGNTWPNGEGLVIFEEFSDHPDAIDFSPAAATWTMPPISRLQAGAMPSVAGALRNLLTGEVLDSLPEIFEYMISVNQSMFRFHTTLHTILDADGNPLPPAHFATIAQANSYTFLITLDGVNPALIRCYPDGSGGWIQTYLLQDTAWVDLDITGPVATPSANPQYRRMGKDFMLDGAVALSGHAAGQFYQVALLPEEFRPRKTQFYPASVVSTLQSNMGRVRVTTGGFVEVSLSEATSGTITLSGVRYPIA